MKKTALLSLICIQSFAGFSQQYNSLLKSKVVVGSDQTTRMNFVDNTNLYAEKWDTLTPPLFWQDVIALSPDSCIINTAGTRATLQKISMEEWKCQTESEKNDYRRFLADRHDIVDKDIVYVTQGKKDFYEYKRVIPFINKAVTVFNKNNVDPWYAQSILLIESPGKSCSKSYVGANGPFQLMKSVAVKYGLHVNRKVDQRTDLEMSALAASKLLKSVCIPRVKKLLDSKNIAYNETNLWFRLLVLHAYHAGVGNVDCVINKINPAEGGISLFTTLWKTECGGFKNESQNYSQIALANIITFESFINQYNDTVYLVQGDKLFSDYKKTTALRNPNFLSSIARAYENDLVDGTITVDYFEKKINSLQKEQALLAVKNPDPVIKEGSKKFPLNLEQCLSLGKQLLRKNKLADAIKILELSIANHPYSPLPYDSLGRAYQLSGKKSLALKYFNKSEQMSKNTAILD